MRSVSSMDHPKKLALRDIRASLHGAGRILEIGFGDGGFLKSLCEAGYEVMGTETSGTLVQEAQRNLPQAKIFLADDPSTLPDVFDAVCCFEVLEHLIDPVEMAKKVPSTVLYGSVPNPRRWYPSMTGKYEYWDHPPNHLWKFCLCEPIAADHHDSHCKLTRTGHLSPGQQGMSIRWLLQQAGYTRISVEPTLVQSHDLLRMIPIRKNVKNYDEMRSKGTKSFITSTARRMLQPITFPTASALNLFRAQGVSFYINAVRGG